MCVYVMLSIYLLCIYIFVCISISISIYLSILRSVLFLPLGYCGKCLMSVLALALCQRSTGTMLPSLNSTGGGRDPCDSSTLKLGMFYISFGLLQPLKVIVIRPLCIERLGMSLSISCTACTARNHQVQVTLADNVHITDFV